MIPLRSRSELHAYLDGFATDDPALGPQVDDLHTLYQHARLTAVVSALEIGSGWSTLVLALAIHENQRTFTHTARHPGPWRLHTIDASQHWADLAVSRLPATLRPIVDVTVSPVEPCDVNGRACHRFTAWPACAPDLIYLDGPDPNQTTGVRGQSPDEHGLPMSADLIAVEPHLWPGTVIVVDGRTANARFLATHLSRPWQVYEDPFGDRTWLRLNEAPLGPVQQAHIDTRMSAARLMREGGHSAPWGPVG